MRTKGYCRYCGKEYTKAGMIKHLRECRKRVEKIQKCMEKETCGGFWLVITGKYRSEYWLIVKVKETISLAELDKFIRDIWVECCGHLSNFEIDGTRYESDPCDDWWGRKQKSMNSRLNKVLTVGTKFAYEYDYGSTTELLLQVIDYEKECPEKEKITILSRNQPLHHVCDKCGVQEAVCFDVEFMYHGSGDEAFLCEKCMESLGEEGWCLPVCNSPRMGVCGYEGSKKYPDEFLPEDVIRK